GRGGEAVLREGGRVQRQRQRAAGAGDADGAAGDGDGEATPAGGGRIAVGDVGERGGGGAVGGRGQDGVRRGRGEPVRRHLGHGADGERVRAAAERVGGGERGAELRALPAEAERARLRDVGEGDVHRRRHGRRLRVAAVPRLGGRDDAGAVAERRVNELR